jgi:hypothetical protein
MYTLLRCTEQALEVCVIEPETKSSELRILALQRAPSANLNQFIDRLDATLKHLYNPKSELLIRGGMNVDCLNDNNRKNN